MKRNVLNSPRLLELKKQRRNVLKYKIFLYLLGFLVVFGSSIYLSRISKLNISNVEVEGNTIIDSEMIKGVVQKETSKNYFWVFPKTNIFFYPKNNIAKELRIKFKRLKDIEFSISKNGILEIRVSEREPEYTWCGVSMVDLAQKEKCYFLDKEGYVFDEAPYFSGAVYFKFYGKVEQIEDSPLGSYFFRENFPKLISLKIILENLDLKPVMLYVEDGGNVTIHLSSGAAQDHPEVRLKLDSDLDRIKENLEAALTTEPLQTEFKKKYDSLLYLDLRFGNKVYYKFR